MSTLLYSTFQIAVLSQHHLEKVYGSPLIGSIPAFSCANATVLMIISIRSDKAALLSLSFPGFLGCYLPVYFSR